MGDHWRDHDDAPASAETAPLLGSNAPSSRRDASPDSISSLKSNHNASVLWRLALPLFCGSLAMSMTTTPLLGFVESAACRLWYLLNDPDAIPPNGTIPEHMCHLQQQNSPQAYFATAVMIAALINAAGHIVASTIVSKVANIWGRRRAYLILCFLDLLANLFLVLAVSPWTKSPFSLYLFGVGMLLASMASAQMQILPATMMIADTTDPTSRTLYISRLQSAFWFGVAPGYVLGGYADAGLWDGSPFHIAFALVCLNIFLALFLVPETLPPSVKIEIAHEREIERSRSREASRARILHVPFWKRSLETVQHWIAVPFEPLKTLAPRRNAISGKRDWRLILLAASAAINSLGGTFAGQAIIVYSADRLGYQPQDMGWLLSGIQMIKVVFLLFILPRVMTVGRAYIDKRTRRAAPLPPSPTQFEETTDSGETVAEHDANRFDVYLMIASWMYESILMVGLIFVRDKWSFGIISICIGLAIGWNAALNSAVVASVPRTETSGVLSAIMMVLSTAEVLSSLVMGNLLSMSIGVFPGLTFLVIAGCQWLASFIALFIRDPHPQHHVE